MRRDAVSLVLLLVAVLIWGGAPSAAAPSPPTTKPLDREIEAAREEVEAASEEEARLLEQIQDAQARKRELDDKVAALEAEVTAAQRAVAAAESQLAALEAEQRKAQARLDETLAALAAAKAELARQAIAAYTGQSEATRYVDVALRSRDMAELVSKRAYLKVVAGSQAETVSRTEALRNQVGDLRDQLDASRAKARDQRDVVASQHARLASQRDAQSSAASEVAEVIAEDTRLKDEALQRKEEFEAKADALEAESDAIAATLRRRAEEEAAARAQAARPPPPALTPGVAPGPSPTRGPAGPPAPVRPGARLANPLPGAPITSGFGYRVHPIYGTSRMHTGVDMAAPAGTAIRSAGDGVVVSAGSQSGYGNTTVIDHGGGLATLYAHQSSIGVSSGQRVTQGQVIGRVGCTGACTGDHLHFEVRVNGSPVNPMGYI
jgi:murein DD-endopeptidase MepM/ murein hydrolase activator NlpD